MGANEKFGEDLLDAAVTQAIDAAVSDAIEAAVEAGKEAFAEIELEQQRARTRGRTEPPPLPPEVSRKRDATVPPPIPKDAEETARKKRATDAIATLFRQEEPKVPFENVGVPSGLMDINKLRTAYEGERPARPPTEPVEPPPIIRPDDSGLLVPRPPTEAEGTSPRYYFALGFVTALALVGISMGTYAFLTRDQQPEQQVAAATPDVPVPVSVPDPAPATVPVTTPDAAPPVVAANTTPPPTTPTPTPTSTPTTTTKPDPKPEPEPDPKPRRPRTPPPDPEPEPEPEPTPDPDPPLVTDPAPHVPVRTASGDICDEVKCLTDGTDPCCGKLRIVKATTPPPEPEPELPDRPTRDDVSKAVRGIRARLGGCAERTDYGGNATLVFSVLPDGSVKGGKSLDGPPEFKACAAAAISSMSLPESKLGLSVRYPFVFK